MDGGTPPSRRQALRRQRQLVHQNPNPHQSHPHPFPQNPNSSSPVAPQPQFSNSDFPIPQNPNSHNAQTPRRNHTNSSRSSQRQSEAQNATFARLDRAAPPPPPLNPNDNDVRPPGRNYSRGGSRKQHYATIAKLDRAVTRARRDLVESKENVSVWKVSQAALMAVKAESWESLGFQMQQVPSLKDLLITEGKVNTFIHCFVAVRRIASLYDLDVAICKSEGVEHFDELELGPLTRHPLSMHYFSVTSDVMEAHRITTEQIIFYFCEFLDTHKRKECNVDEFLDFMAMKQSVASRERLCVRVQNFGQYKKFIKSSRRSEQGLLKECFGRATTKASKTRERRMKNRLFSFAQRKQLDNHLFPISQPKKSFTDSDSEDNECNDNQDEKNGQGTCSFSRPNFTLGCSGDNEHPKKKRKLEIMRSSTSTPKLPKLEDFDSYQKHLGSGNQGMTDNSLHYLLRNESMRTFVATWKEACQGEIVDEVLEKMLQFYNTKKKGRIKALLTSYPFVGLLNVAVICIKCGLLDYLYLSSGAFSPINLERKTFESTADHTSIFVEPAKKDVTVSAPKTKYGFSAEDIVDKISDYLGDDIFSHNKHSREINFLFLRKLRKCEFWLIEQHSVKEFESLGYGEYIFFLEKYMHLLPHALQRWLMGDVREKVSLEAHLLPLQFGVLLSQTLNSLTENEILNLQHVSELLTKQFPLVRFELLKNPSANIADILREERFKLTSNCILFSTPLLRLNWIHDVSVQNEKKVEPTCGNTGMGAIDGIISVGTAEDAIEVFLKAPMLIDLKLWSHWDLSFAPSLGSIVEWLLNDVNTKDLLCLVTKDGKVIRIDHSATMDSFLEVFIQGSAFETALKLLSVFALYGGECNVPLSLLKCHARQAFEVIINNLLEMEVHDDKNPLVHVKPSGDQDISGKNISSNSGSKLPYGKIMPNKVVQVTSSFILGCLSFLPIEFCSFAADVLISGLQSFVKDVPSAILTECKQIEQRLMLHEVGISLGIVEWVNDYRSFCSAAKNSLSPESSCFDLVSSELNTRSMIMQDVQNRYPTSCFDAHCRDENFKQVNSGSGSAEVAVDDSAAISEKLLTFGDHINIDPARVIESIRKEEFGLDSGLSDTENRMLEKQHARLGRALHCLSQELYSQDSHFLLELVQNADDNIYPTNVEPTLTFILQEKCIIVLNNEQGFLANNIRALCDVGNSTKKGHNTGYIGKKGIGFKSVFRVTDAPEIHSNGFHIKFDITKGQIGFVLPTFVPPCDIELFSRLASAGDSYTNQNACKTCIVLPFRSTVSEGFAMKNVVPMFSDLHPSMLLFLHRLQCIKFRNMLDDSLIVMRKEKIGDGIVQVTLGNEKMTWFLVSQKLQANIVRSDVQTTEIFVAFTLQETDAGGFIPVLSEQPVFAFLPLRTYGLKFILQGDFVLPSSREEVDGSSPWNQWLLSRFPDLFVSAVGSFCDLPCYRRSPGKAVAAYMSFIPLLGEVHGFFSSLPRMIISKLRVSNCLLLDSAEKEWVPPCKVLRNWTDQTRSLLPDKLLQEHLGLGFLHRDIVLSDSLARALGVEEYGPKVLLKVISSVCCTVNGIKSMGLSWLCSWLSTMYVMSFQSSMQTSAGIESGFMNKLQKIPFIPLSNGKYGSLNGNTIWLHCNWIDQDTNGESVLKAFPILNAKLQTVSPDLFAAAVSIENPCSDTTVLENVTRMLYKIGVQRLSAHEILKTHILSALSDAKNARQEELMIEYLCFAMFHLQSSCTTCSLERSGIIAEFHEKAVILTNHGFKRSNEVPIHFSREFGNPVDIHKLISGLEVEWHEIDSTYIQHPITKSVSGGMLKWRSFFQEIGVTDFVRIVQVDKSVTDMPLVNIKDIMMGDGMVSMNSVARNWESEELFLLVSLLSSRKDRVKSKYLLEFLDRLWDDYFSDKVTGYCVDSTGECRPFKSSLLSILQDVPWISSNISDELYYPKDLFHNCEAVNSVLGVTAPYTIPKVRSEKLLADVGLKTHVTLDDALFILKVWRGSESSLKASILQMSNFYAFLWKGMALSKNKIMEVLHSGPFIFVPHTAGCTDGDVDGALLSPQEVYWQDITCLTDQTSSVHPECVPNMASSALGKMLCNFYPNLHDFFVGECGVDETPPSRSYLQILLQLSTIALPHAAAKRVSELFLRWSDALNSGSLTLEDVEYLKESLLKKEYAVLPTRQDKWVSLHASFGVICWCDDDNLEMEFKHAEGIDLLYFGELSDEENKVLQAKISTIMQRLGIPALSEIATREAIYYGPADCNSISSLLNWILPYAQRYIFNAYPENYFHLKQSGFESIRHLKIVVVEKLYYRNVVKKSDITSKKRHECNCILQDKILYCNQGSDPHSIFLEFSRLVCNGNPVLDFANFLHMIITMAESDATEEQTEFFILNSQKVPKLPVEELCWSFQSSVEKHAMQEENCLSRKVKKPNSSMFMRRTGINSNWPPEDWKTAPGFNSATSFGSTKVADSSLQKGEGNVIDKSLGIFRELNTEAGENIITYGEVILDDNISECLPNFSRNLAVSSRDVVLDAVDLVPPESFNLSSPNISEQALITGRLGEISAFKYFMGKFGDAFVKWVNEANETGLPYDIILGNDETNTEYVEVKATKSERKNWFDISIREWQFAIEKGESYSIAHVVLSDNESRVTVYKNPARLCRLGDMMLAIVMPNRR